MFIALIAIGMSMQAADKAAVRSELEQVYKKWGEARITLNKEFVENTLRPDFYVLLQDGKHTREEFVTMATTVRPNVHYTRFDSRIITLNKVEEDWIAVITEKLEVDVTPKSGKPFHAYSYWVTKDGWHKDADGQWRAKYSEAIGNEGWRDTKPPFDDWDK